MSEELEQILDFADVLVKSSLLNSNDKERLAQWREDREKLYTALERKEKLEKAWEIVKDNIDEICEERSGKFGGSYKDHYYKIDIDYLDETESNTLKEMLK